jgi:uncharacterized membrane protein YuzA (DUF378 family)
MDRFASTYNRLLLQKVALALLIAGALNWLFIGAFNTNLLQGIFGLNVFTRTIYVLVGFAAVFLMFRRDFYLPFLGETVFPCANLEDRKPSGADISVSVQTHPLAKVIYWAAEPTTEELKNIHDWKKAYSAYENVGITTASETGAAILIVRKPQPYTVPFRGRLEPHIHYRICEEGGMMGPVRTVFIADAGSNDAIEGFANPGGATADKKGFNINTQIDPDKLLSNLTKALPQVQAAMNALNAQFAIDPNQGQVESADADGSIGGQTIQEAFRSY